MPVDDATVEKDRSHAGIPTSLEEFVPTGIANFLCVEVGGIRSGE